MEQIDLNLLNEKLANVTGSFQHFLPELSIFIFLLLLVITDLLIFRKNKTLTGITALIGLVITFLIAFLQWKKVTEEGSVSLFNNMIRLDSLAAYLKMFFTTGGLFTVLFSFFYMRGNEVNDSLKRTGEYYMALFSVIAGTFLMAMASNLLMIYLSIEVVSISSYILTQFDESKRGTEAGIKYLLFGAIASGIMLYGMSLLYGYTGTLDIYAGSFKTGLREIHSLPLVIGMVLTTAGFLFKISAVPFHIWAPDVYEGAPTPVTAFFSVVPKIAGIAVLIRMLGVYVDISSLNFKWQWIVSIIAMITMIVGNFSALWQNNAKRMMAYSSIAHAGYILVGVMAYSEFGVRSVVFYASIYMLMNFAAFFIITVISNASGVENITEYKGLGMRYPFLGVLMLIVMVSLTGLPPTAGFTAKLLIFSSLWETIEISKDSTLFWLLIIGLFNTVISLFYYLKIPYFMFFKKSENNVEFLTFTISQKIFAIILIFPLLFLFFKSDWLLSIINKISFAF